MRRSMSKVAVGCGATIMLLLSVTTPVSGQESRKPEKHCNTRVLGTSPSGEYILTPQECFDTFDAAARAGGVRASETITPTNIDSLMDASVAATYIGIHYDGTNWTGSSMSVQGSGCSGGGINWATAQSGQWNNRFSSTRNYCQYGAYVCFYDPSNYVAPYLAVQGWYDRSELGTLNNKTSSTKYGCIFI